MNEEQSDLRHYGDKELWYVQGVIPEGSWSLPLWVNRYRSEDTEYVLVTPIAILPYQMEKLESMFGEKVVWKKGLSFVLEDADFRAKAYKAAGVTPDYYRSWPGFENGVPRHKNAQIASWDVNEVNDEATSFLKYIADKRGISFNLLKLVWWSVCEEGAVWMIAERKPIHLGFVTLYPIPFRQNWKEIMLLKHPHIAKVFKKPASERDQVLYNEGFVSDICSCHNLAIDKNLHTLHWTIEAVPEDDWDTTCERIEVTRMQSLGKNDYMAFYEKTILKIIPNTIKAMGKYLSKIAIPFADFFEGNRTGVKYLVPYRGNKLRQKADRKLVCRIMVDDEAIGFGKSYSEQKYLHEAVDELPQVHTISQAAENLRQSGEQRVLDQSTDGQQGTARLSLPHAVQSEAAGESVLPEPDDKRTERLE